MFEVRGGGFWRCTGLAAGAAGRVMMLVGWTRLLLFETAAAVSCRGAVPWS